jgi:hypothetical protein
MPDGYLIKTPTKIEIEKETSLQELERHIKSFKYVCVYKFGQDYTLVRCILTQWDAFNAM